MAAHEHHSFPSSPDRPDPEAEAQVRAVQQRLSERTAAKDVAGMVETMTADIVSYEHEPPLRSVGVDAVRDVCERGVEASSGDVGWTVPELKVLVGGDLAVTWGLDRMTARTPDGTDVEMWGGAVPGCSVGGTASG